jgi:TGS domain
MAARIPGGRKAFKSARAMVHHDFRAQLKYARVWGHGRFEGQMVNRDYPLVGKDVIEPHRLKEIASFRSFRPLSLWGANVEAICRGRRREGAQFRRGGDPK